MLGTYDQWKRTYDQWKSTDPRDTDPSGEPESDCPVCVGGDGAPCSEECSRIAALAADRRAMKRLVNACRMALELARRYRAEGDGLESPRLLATLARYGELREELRGVAARARAQTGPMR